MSQYNIQSGAQAVITDVPDISYIVESLLRPQSKFAVIGKWKTAKSFLTMQLGMSVASGSEFLGFKTAASNVLYINFEISEEMFHQRIQDMFHIMPNLDLSRFHYLTINQLMLDISNAELKTILNESISAGFPVQVLIIDPRLNAITKDSNQDEVVRAFCVNLDEIISTYKLSVVIVHHEGVSTSSDKAGKGSTAFDAWLTGWLKIKPKNLTDLRELDITSRDCEKQSILAQFKYPIHYVAPDVIAGNQARAKAARDCIIATLGSNVMLERDVRFRVLGAGHSDWAFNRARQELVNSGRILMSRAPGQAGNVKLMQLK